MNNSENGGTGLSYYRGHVWLVATLRHWLRHHQHYADGKSKQYADMVPAIVGRDSFISVGLCPKSVQLGSVCACRLYFDDDIHSPR